MSTSDPRSRHYSMKTSYQNAFAYNPIPLPTNFEIGDEETLQNPVQNSRIGSDKVLWVQEHGYVLSCVGVIASIILFAVCSSFGLTPQEEPYEILGTAWSANFPPYSFVDPITLGINYAERDEAFNPGPIFSKIPPGQALPTNSWCENFFLGEEPNNGLDNSVFQIPYIVDTGGAIQGVRAHPPHVLANDRSVMMTYEPENGLTLGASEQFQSQHHVGGEQDAIARLAVVLEWDSGVESSDGIESGPRMKAPVVRGAPYLSMEYFGASPRIVGQRFFSAPPVVDLGQLGTELVCGEGIGIFGPPVTVQREIQLQFDTSDMTWLVFLSEPMRIACSMYTPPPAFGPALPPGVVEPMDPSQQPYFELKALNAVDHGMVRIAMANNCSTGQNRQYCDDFSPRDQTDYMALLRNHADVFPTGHADIQFTFPSTSDEEQEELRLIFEWKPSYMSQLKTYILQNPTPNGIPAVELLMYATPHHQQRLRPTLVSTNQVLTNNGCFPTIHGSACLVLGSTWSMVEHLHPISFQFTHAPREEMLHDIKKALKVDINFQLPENYMQGAGDTYFSGKMLAKLARVLLHANQVKGSVTKSEFADALDRLKRGVQVWLDGSAKSPFLYDAKWGGLVMCGCDFNGDTQSCNNMYPDCPALVDAGLNFGAGFYNDHHFHFGYHIYAAAVVAKFDSVWGAAYYQHVLLLVRDIANPSPKDPFFPVWRHKDWFLGFSWASGIVTIQGKPYPNGRNQESSSEAIHAYEAVALYGKAMMDIFKTSRVPTANALYEDALRVRDMGRLLLATEIRSARTYWHVQKRDTLGVDRVYPDVYTPDVIGMMWSRLVQEQTWFGNEPWKSYGIQLMPLTVASEQRDAPSWVKDMLPMFKASCDGSPNCESDGWSILVHACQATNGNWTEAWNGINMLPLEVFSGAGGNGHSRSNSLMHIATRRPPSLHDIALGNAYGEPNQTDAQIII